MDFIRLDLLKDYGYTPIQWQEEVSREDKVLMLEKRSLEIERDKRIQDKHSQDNKENKKRRRNKGRRRV